MPQDGKRRPKRESSTKKRLRLAFPHQLHGDVIYMKLELEYSKMKLKMFGAKPPCQSLINQLQIDQKCTVLQKAEARRFPRRGGGT